MRFVYVVVGAVCFASVLPSVGWGQVVGDRPYISLVGYLVDFQSGRPISGALATADELDRATTTDARGYFRLRVPDGGRVELRFEQLGYRTTSAVLASASARDTLSVAMSPDPIALQGVEVSVAQQGLQSARAKLETRRRAYVGSVVLLDRARLARSAAASARDDVQAAVPALRPCNVDAVGNLCIGRRPPRVCIDGVRALGGPADLRAYSSDEIDSIELYNRGSLIVVYTRSYMARAMLRTLPINPIPELEC